MHDAAGTITTYVIIGPFLTIEAITSRDDSLQYLYFGKVLLDKAAAMRKDVNTDGVWISITTSLQKK